MRDLAEESTPLLALNTAVVLLAVLTLASPAIVQAELILQENFEGWPADRPPIGWELNVPKGAGRIQVSSVPGPDGHATHCLCLSDSSSGCQLSAELQFSPITDKIAVEYDTMISARTNQACTCLYVERAVCLAFVSDSLTYFDGGSAKAAFQYEPSRWYHVKYLISPATHTYALYIDGRLVAANIRFRRPTKQFSSLQCETGRAHSRGLLYLDNVVVRTLTRHEGVLLHKIEREEKQRLERLQRDYEWLDASQLKVPDDWGLGAWYRMSGAKDVHYDLSAGIELDDTHQAKEHAILLEGEMTKVERFAAKELQKYLFRITDTYVPIISKPNPAHRVVFHVGSQLDARLQGDCDDSFAVVGQTGRLVLTGACGRGTLYSVYHFLEKHLGCRWYYPDPYEEVIPQKRMKDVDAVLADGFDDFEQPAMKYRSLMILNTDACIESEAWNPDWRPLGTQVGRDEERRWLRNQLVRTVYQIDWMAKNRFNAVVIEGSWGGMHILPENWDVVRTIFPEIEKRGLRLGLGGHFWTPFLNDNMPNWPDDDTWGAFSSGRRHPVKLCSRVFFCTTNQDALSNFLRHVVSFFRANPEFDIWAVWPPDTSHGCQCSTCSLFSLPYRCIRVHNQIAQALEAETARASSPVHGKEIPVVLIAYSSSSTPPEQELTLHPRVAIMPDIYQRFSRPYVPGPADSWKLFLRSNGSDNELILFGRFCRSFLIGYRLLPPPTIPETIRNLIRDDFCGVELFHGCGGWWVKGLWQYATSKLMWNPKARLSEIVDDFFCHYYGPAAQPMRAFYEAIERAHSDSDMNYDYGANHDVCPWWRMRKCPRINPDWDGTYLPGIPGFVDQMLALGPTALHCFTEAAKLAKDAPNPGELLKRINKARLSWQYYRNQKLNEKYQFDGFCRLERAYMDSQSLNEYRESLSAARQEFEKSHYCFLHHIQLVQEHTLLHGSFSADQGVFWDGGVILYNRSEQWLEIIQRAQEQSQKHDLASILNNRPWVVRYPPSSK